jgi:hypothetical protein
VSARLRLRLRLRLALRAVVGVAVAASVVVLACCSSSTQCSCTAERAGVSQEIACGQSACVGGELVTCNGNAIGFGGACTDGGD